MQKFDFRSHLDLLVHEKHHMLSYTVQRILLQLVTGAEATLETLVQSATIFFHYRFIPWECVVVDGKIGLIVPYQQDTMYDLIVGKADIKYIEDVYTLMWVPYLVLFLPDFDVKKACSSTLLDFIDTIANFTTYDSICNFYKKCVFVPRIFITRAETMEVTEQKVANLLKLYTRYSKCTKLTKEAAEYYNLFVSREFLIGSIDKSIKEPHQGTILPKMGNFVSFLSSFDQRHSTVPDFKELDQVTWTRENAAAVSTIPFRPSPTPLLEAFKNDYSISLTDSILSIYVFLSSHSTFLQLSPFTFSQFLDSFENSKSHLIMDATFLSLLFLVRATIEKDKFPISNSHKYVNTDKATAMVIKNDVILSDFLPQAKTILQWPLAEKKMFKYTRYYKPVIWVFCFAIFLREFVDIEQVPHIIEILEQLLEIQHPMQVDGDWSSDDESFNGPNRAITRSMETEEEIMTTYKRSSRASSLSSKRLKANPIEEAQSVETTETIEVQPVQPIHPLVIPEPITKKDEKVDEIQEIAFPMIARFHLLDHRYKIELMQYMISVLVCSREFALYIDRFAFNDPHNIRLDPIGKDRFENKYYYIPGCHYLLVYGSGVGSSLFGGNNAKLPGPDIPHYSYMTTTHQLPCPEGFDDGTTHQWMCWTSKDKVQLLIKWLSHLIPQEQKLKSELQQLIHRIDFEPTQVSFIHLAYRRVCKYTF